MKTYIAHKQDDSIVITVPDHLSVKPGDEFIVLKHDGGSFTYVPKLDDIFLTAKENGYNLRPEKDAWDE